jgi:hypothetical protein
VEHRGISRHNCGKARRARPQAEVEILESKKIVLVEQADCGEHLAFHQHQAAADAVHGVSAGARACEPVAHGPVPHPSVVFE